MAALEPGTYIRTHRGLSLIVAVDHKQNRYLVSSPGSKEQWIDAETVLPSEVVTSLTDPETAEAYLNGDLDSTPVETVEAVDLPCIRHYKTCKCLWCYKVSSNGFHMVNRGQCRCTPTTCPCAEGTTRDG